MEAETCKQCDTELNYGEREIEFYDEDAMEIFRVELKAYWCTCCSYSKVVRS